jgi:hypothetical protein
VAHLIIPEKLWQDFTVVAQRQRRKAETLAEEVLRDFLQRTADTNLLQRSEHAARRSGVRMGEAEQVVRQYRRSTQG